MIPSVIYSLIKFLQSLPVLVGIGVVAVTAVLAKILIDRKKKQITLEDPNTKYALKLVEKHNISHDTRKFVFALPSENHVLGLPVGEINLHIWILDKNVLRTRLSFLFHYRTTYLSVSKSWWFTRCSTLYSSDFWWRFGAHGFGHQSVLQKHPS